MLVLFDWSLPLGSEIEEGSKPHDRTCIKRHQVQQTRLVLKAPNPFEPRSLISQAISKMDSQTGSTSGGRHWATVVYPPFETRQMEVLVILLATMQELSSRPYPKP